MEWHKQGNEDMYTGSLTDRGITLDLLLFKSSITDYWKLVIRERESKLYLAEDIESTGDFEDAKPKAMKIIHRLERVIINAFTNGMMFEKRKWIELVRPEIDEIIGEYASDIEEDSDEA